MKIKELSVEETKKKAKELLKRVHKLTIKDFTPGNIIHGKYNAKDKTMIFDKTPLTMILRVTSRHLLGLNFHWLPYTFRIRLVKEILEMNKSNIKHNKPLQFSYKALRPFLKKHGYMPCIRCYITSRWRRSGVSVPPEDLLGMARLNMMTFNGGIPEEQVYRLARAGKLKLSDF